MVPSLYARKIGASQQPISAEYTMKQLRTAPVDILLRRAGITKAITSMAMSIPQNTIWLPKKKESAAGDEATPRAQNAETSSPINMRTYTRFITALVCRVTAPLS